MKNFDDFKSMQTATLRHCPTTPFRRFDTSEAGVGRCTLPVCWNATKREWIIWRLLFLVAICLLNLCSWIVGKWRAWLRRKKLSPWRSMYLLVGAKRFLYLSFPFTCIYAHIFWKLMLLSVMSWFYLWVSLLFVGVN